MFLYLKNPPHQRGGKTSHFKKPPQNVGEKTSLVFWKNPPQNVGEKTSPIILFDGHPP